MLALAAALLAICAPGAAASSLTASVVRHGSTQALVWLLDVQATTTGDVLVDYGPTTAYGTTVTVFPGFVGGPAPDAMTAVLTGLQPGTTYHVRGRISEPGGDTSSTDQTFTTAPLGAALLTAAAESLAGAPMLSGLPAVRTPFQVCADGSPTAGAEVMVRYRAYKVTVPAAAPGCATVQVESTCPVLRVGAYRGAFAGTTFAGAVAAVAGDASGLRELQFPVAADGTFTVVVSDDLTCTAGYALRVYSAAVVPPTAGAAKASDAGVKSATLRATASALRVRGVTARFEVGRTTAYGATAPAGTVAADATGHAVSARVTGLAGNVLYHARLVVTGPGGTVKGPDVTFRTRRRQAALKLASATVGVSARGTASVRVRCPATTTTCRGTVALRRSSGDRRRLGSATFRITGGRTGTVKVRLPAAGRDLVRSLGRIGASVALTARDGDRVAFPSVRKRAMLAWRG